MSDLEPVYEYRSEVVDGNLVLIPVSPDAIALQDHGVAVASFDDE